MMSGLTKKPLLVSVIGGFEAGQSTMADVVAFGRGRSGAHEDETDIFARAKTDLIKRRINR